MSAILRKCPSFVTLLAICIGTAQTFAAEPASFDAGILEATPLFGVTADHDNNVFSTTDDEFTSNILRINPNLKALAEIGGSTYCLNAECIDSRQIFTESPQTLYRFCCRIPSVYV